MVGLVGSLACGRCCVPSQNDDHRHLIIRTETDNVSLREEKSQSDLLLCRVTVSCHRLLLALSSNPFLMAILAFVLLRPSSHRVLARVQWCVGTLTCARVCVYIYIYT